MGMALPLKEVGGIVLKETRWEEDWPLIQWGKEGETHKASLGEA